MNTEEAHDTAPAKDSADTRGVKIDEAHRSSPKDTPSRADDLRQ